MNDRFVHLSRRAARLVEGPCFAALLGVVSVLLVGWGTIDPAGYGEREPLIATVLALAALYVATILQAAQSRDTRELKAELAELLRAVEDADDRVADADELSEQEIEAYRRRTR